MLIRLGVVLSLIVIVCCPSLGQAEPIRVVELADGSVSIISSDSRKKRPNETEADFYKRVFDAHIQAHTHLQGRPYYDLDRSQLPTDGSQANRHKWRYKPTTGKVEVDATVPDLPKPNEQKRKEACAQAAADLTTTKWLKDFCATF